MLFPGELAALAHAPIHGVWDVGGAALSLGQLPVCKTPDEGTQSLLSWEGSRGQGGGFGNRWSKGGYTPLLAFTKLISKVERQSKVPGISVVQKTFPQHEVPQDNWRPRALVLLEGSRVVVRVTVAVWLFLGRRWVLFWN